MCSGLFFGCSGCRTGKECSGVRVGFVGGSGGGGLLQHPVDERAEFQFIKNFAQGFFVGFFAHQCLHVEFDGYIGLDGSQKLGERDLFLVGLHLCLQCALELVGILQQVFDAAKLSDEFLSRFFAHARTAWDVIRSIAHQAQHVDDLCRSLYVELGLDLFHTHHLETARMFGTVHEDTVRYQLSVVFVGRHHVGGDTAPASFGGKGTYHVVGFVTRHLEDGDAIGTYDVLDDGHREADDLGRLFALCLVLLVGLVAESRSGGVESHADVRGIFFLEHLFERVDKAHYGRCVEALGVDTRVLDERVVSPVYQRIGVEQEEFIV